MLDKLEHEVECDLSLRGRAVEKSPLRPFKFYLEIIGSRKATNRAIARIEDVLVEDSGTLEAQRLLLHDIAQANSRDFTVIRVMVSCFSGMRWSGTRTLLLTLRGGG